MNEDRFLTRRRFMMATGSTLAALGTGPAFAEQPRLRIDPNAFQPMPIAIPNFVGGTPSDGDLGAGVAQVITNNLKRSGLFAPIDQAAYIDKIVNFDVAPQFNNWKSINAQALVTGRMTRQADGHLTAEFRLWEVATGGTLDGKQYSAQPENWRRIAHIISDQIYVRLTGEKGYFDSRVVFVDETGPKERRIKKLALMDQDGFNVRYLTRGSDLVLTPRFSPSTQDITYMEFGQGDPRVYLMNIDSQQREVVGNFPGMSFSPRFSPDGQRVIMSLQPVRDGPAVEKPDTADRYACDRYLAVLRARRQSDLLRVRPRRKAADLCDAGRRWSGPAHLFRRRPILHARMVTARRLHRVHQARRRTILHRHHEARRVRRTPSHLGIPQRRTDVCAERAGLDVLPRSGREWRPVSVYG
jgi:hypothetical protein